MAVKITIKFKVLGKAGLPQHPVTVTANRKVFSRFYPVMAVQQKLIF